VHQRSFASPASFLIPSTTSGSPVQAGGVPQHVVLPGKCHGCQGTARGNTTMHKSTSIHEIWMWSSTETGCLALTVKEALSYWSMNLPTLLSCSILFIYEVQWWYSVSWQILEHRRTRNFLIWGGRLMRGRLHLRRTVVLFFEREVNYTTKHLRIACPVSLAGPESKLKGDTRSSMHSQA
jgi:hypothetical protein